VADVVSTVTPALGAAEDLLLFLCDGSAQAPSGAASLPPRSVAAAAAQEALAAAAAALDHALADLADARDARRAANRGPWARVLAAAEDARSEERGADDDDDDDPLDALAVVAALGARWELLLPLPEPHDCAAEVPIPAGALAVCRALSREWSSVCKEAAHRQAESHLGFASG
jgi:hypothetical protein